MTLAQIRAALIRPEDGGGPWTMVNGTSLAEGLDELIAHYGPDWIAPADFDLDAELDKARGFPLRARAWRD